MRTKSICLIWPQLIILPNMWQGIQREYLLFEIKNSLPACFNSDDFQDSGISIETNLYGHSWILACFSSYLNDQYPGMYKVQILWEGHKIWKNLSKSYLATSNQSGRYLHIVAGFSENLNFTSILPDIMVNRISKISLTLL